MSTQTKWILLLVLMAALIGTWYAFKDFPKQPDLPVVAETVEAVSPTEEKIAHPIEIPAQTVLTPEWEIRRMIQLAEETPALADLLMKLSDDGEINTEEVKTLWQPTLVRLQVERCDEIWTGVKLAMGTAAENPLAVGLKEAGVRGVAGAEPAGAFNSQPVLSEDLADDEWTKVACEQMMLDVIRLPALAPDFEAILADGEITNEEVQNTFVRAKALRTQQQLLDRWRETYR